MNRTKVAEAGGAGKQAFASWDDGLLERIPIAVYCCERDGVVVRYNRRAAELWGRAPQPGDTHERFCGSHRLFLPDGEPLPHAETPMARVLETGEPARDEEVWIERPDGSRIAVLVNIDPLFDAGGNLTGAVNCFQDVTARIKAEAALQERESWYHRLLQALPAALYTTDAAGRITFFNEAAAQLWGCRPRLGSAQWCGSWRIFTTEGKLLPHDECPMAVALKENRPIRGTDAVAERPDGTRVPFLPFPTPLRDDNGKLLGAVNMLVDITERKQAEESQALLIRELAHRVKNTLAVILSMARQSLRGAPANGFGESFLGRLQALARAHEVLFAADWRGAELGALAREQVAPLASEAPERLRIDGPRVVLPPSHATALGLLLHELATNASKYGALSTDSCSVEMRWRLNGSNGTQHVVIDWIEFNGPAVSPPLRQGLGSRLIQEGVPGASVDWRFAPDGVRCTIDLALH
ncbi:MAG TPA: PAS domain S-box protein [Afifellaceae bacterium]|nr:PAS domain S-box protein [Afifellaceae bacterium]